jgi:hypothetical protein
LIKAGAARSWQAWFRSHAMGMAFRKDNDVARGKTYRRIVAKLDIATTFHNEMEDHYSLGTGFQ